MAANLTPKQETFCLEYLKTGNATEAYRRAYPSSVKNKEATVNRNAKKLKDNSKVVARLAELKEPVINKSVLSFEEHLNELQRLKQLAEDSGDIRTALMAESYRGKAAGHYSGKGENVFCVQTVPIVQVRKQ